MAQYKGAASEAGRAMQLMKKREKEREQLEQLKQKIAEVGLKQHKPPGVSSRFVPGCRLCLRVMKPSRRFGRETEERGETATTGVRPGPLKLASGRGCRPPA